MDAGGGSSSTASSSPLPESPTTTSERRANAVQAPVTSLQQTPPENSSRLLHQLASDLQQYEAKTTKFLKSLLPRSRSGLNEAPASPNNNDDDSNRTQLDTDSGSSSDGSQNLRGFESTIEDDRSIGSVDNINDEDDDGEECSSSSHSDIYRSYTDKRLAMILNGRSSMMSLQDAHNNNSSALMSSDGEGMIPDRSGRSRSMESRGRSATRGSAQRGASSSRTRAPTDIVSAREQQRIVQLETALSTSNTTNVSTATSPQHQQQQDGKSHHIVDANRLHYASLDRSRLAAVLRVAKDDDARAITLATSYSQLLDRLGIAQSCAGDMQEFSASKSIRLVLSNAVTKDSSKLCIVNVKKLPPVPSSNDQARKQYAINLIRFLLYELEKARFASGGMPPPSESTGTARDATVGSAKGPQQDAASTGPAPDHVDLSGTSVPRMPPKKSKKTQRVRGDSAKKRSADAFTFLIDVGGCDNSTLSSLGVVLSEGAALLRQAYPLSIAKVWLYQGSDPDVHVAAAAVETSSGGGGAKMPRKGPMSVLTSLFQKKDASKTSSNVNDKNNGSAIPSGQVGKLPHSSGSLASKVWLSVMVSTWKLRYLPHTVRSRTELVDRLDSVLDVAELKRLLDAAST